MSQQPRFDVPRSRPSLMQPGDYVRVDARPLGEHLVLVISGEADFYTAEALREDLGRALTPSARSVAVDVSELRFCDLAGLDALDGFFVEAEARQLSLTVHGMSPLLALLRDMFPRSGDERQMTDTRPWRGQGEPSPEQPAPRLP